jgi:hypothetical protein
MRSRSFCRSLWRQNHNQRRTQLCLRPQTSCRQSNRYHWVPRSTNRCALSTSEQRTSESSSFIGRKSQIKVARLNTTHSLTTTRPLSFLYWMGRELSLLAERSRIQHRFLRMIPIWSSSEEGVEAAVSGMVTAVTYTRATSSSFPPVSHTGLARSRNRSCMRWFGSTQEKSCRWSNRRINQT